MIMYLLHVTAVESLSMDFKTLRHDIVYSQQIYFNHVLNNQRKDLTNYVDLYSFISIVSAALAPREGGDRKTHN